MEDPLYVHTLPSPRWKDQKRKKGKYPRDFDTTCLATKWFPKDLDTGTAPVSRIKQLTVSIGNWKAEHGQDSRERNPWQNSWVRTTTPIRVLLIEDVCYTLDLMLYLEARPEKIKWSGQLTAKCMESIAHLSSNCWSLEIDRNEGSDYTLKSMGTVKKLRQNNEIIRYVRYASSVACHFFVSG